MRILQRLKNIASVKLMPSGYHSKAADGLTVRSCLRMLFDQFTAANVMEPEVSAEYITAHVLGEKTLVTIPRNQQLTEQQWQLALELSKQRLNKVPIQYIVGEWEFRDITLKLKPPVFIPRPETEELVSHMLKDPVVTKGSQFLEVGCGSGAVSISLLKELPHAEGVAIDQSAEACQLTTQNARQNQVCDRLRVVQMNLTHETIGNLRKSHCPRIYDFVVSNPPYVPTEDMNKLQPEIFNYEDHRALHGGTDGTDIVKLILQMSSLVLKPVGSLWLEVDDRHPPWIQSYVDAHQATLTHIEFRHAYEDFMGRLRFCHLQHRHQRACSMHTYCQHSQD